MSFFKSTFWVVEHTHERPNMVTRDVWNIPIQLAHVYRNFHRQYFCYLHPCPLLSIPMWVLKPMEFPATHTVFDFLTKFDLIRHQSPEPMIQYQSSKPELSSRALTLDLGIGV
jgi:hypothetical protein